MFVGEVLGFKLLKKGKLCRCRIHALIMEIMHHN